MARRSVHALACAMAIVACACGSTAASGSAAPYPTSTPVAAASPATPAPSPTKLSDPNTSDLVCGVLSANSVTSGQGSGPNTFELRPATSVRTGTVNSARFGGWVSADRPALGGYVCVWLGQGAPMSGFRSQVRVGESGYIAEMLPNLFTLPAGCAYVARPASDPDQVSVRWQFDCGTTANRDARGALGPAFTKQGWTVCSSGLANQTWRQSSSRLTVSEGAGGAGGFPVLTQLFVYTPGGAGCG
jgi:hypothetical protein